MEKLDSSNIAMNKQILPTYFSLLFLVSSSIQLQLRDLCGDQLRGFIGIRCLLLFSLLHRIRWRASDIMMVMVVLMAIGIGRLSMRVIPRSPGSSRVRCYGGVIRVCSSRHDRRSRLLVVWNVRRVGGKGPVVIIRMRYY